MMYVSVSIYAGRKQCPLLDVCLISCSAQPSVLKMEALRSSTMSVNFYETTWHIQGNGPLHSYRCENLKSHISVTVSGVPPQKIWKKKKTHWSYALLLFSFWLSRLAWRYRSGLLFSSCSIRMSVGTPVILTEIFHSFPQSLQNMPGQYLG
jgi:hypothetical protein